MIQTQEIKPLISTATILLLIALIGKPFTQTSFEGLTSLSFAIFAYIILPGYFILLNFKLTSLERIIFGMPTSITIVSIILYTLNILGVALNRLNTILTILAICIISLALKKKFETNNNQPKQK